jgi:signal transduction histidine kinase
MGVTSPAGVVHTGRARDWCQRAAVGHHAIACIAAAVLLFACAMTFAGMREPDALRAAPVAIAVIVYISFAVLPILRWPPWLPLAVATAGAAVSLAAASIDSLVSPALVVAAFVFSRRSEKTPAIAGAVASIGVLLIGHLIFIQAKSGLSDLAVVPWIALAAAVGQAVRGKHAHEAMLEERARRAEESREHEARRRVQQERLRIARELHDAVGHHVALISVQAGAMSYLLDTDPVKARESLAHIQRASEDALEELRLTVGLLRQPGDREPTEPASGLARLGELIDSFETTGLQVACDVTGQVRELPEAVDLTAYRVIQESLTNTAKHAAGAAARIRLEFRPGALALAVEDDGPPVESGANEEGHGIIGMRERAAALGGWLSAGPGSPRGFRVVAELPAQGTALPARGGTL